MSDDARRQLAVTQARLVRALVEGAAAPAGFDRERLAATAEALLLKRARAVAQSWPQLARVMGDGFAARFTSYARANPLPGDGGPLADGRAFVRWLERAGLLSDEGRLEAFAFDARFRIHHDEITPRRGPWLCARRFKGLRRLVIVVRLPFVGERWLNTKIL